jgi:UDP-N-acetyl-D-mannosaminuronic acid dehydrogenase
MTSTTSTSADLRLKHSKALDVLVIGLGYIGLPTASMFAQAGHRVRGYDVSEHVLQSIRSGCEHVGELDVRRLACEALATGNLRVDNAMPERADAYIICVPTPTIGREPDLHYVEAAAAAVASRIGSGELIVLESTVPPRTVENIIVRELEIAGKSPDDVHIAHCPERVIPGSIVNELRHNARVVGGRRPIDAEVARELYASFCVGAIHTTDCATAELVKVVENTFRDVNLAFANELALLAEALGVNAWEVIRLANEHPRVHVLNPGPGVGGHCIPVDPHFLSNANPFITELIQTARRINERMPYAVVRLIDEMLPAARGAKITLLGAAYKADTDDTRESPAHAVSRLLEDRRHTVVVYDPFGRESWGPLARDLDEAVRDADILVLITDHQAFRQINPGDVAQLVRGKVLIDTRNFLDCDAWSAAGFNVRTLGVSTVSPRRELAGVAR